jgi:hypothetical protein
MENADEQNIIRINKSVFIDTKKVKRYLKSGFKFAFSQIGLAGLVVGYVILGALIFMKIEGSNEKHNQEKIERNREEFFENVKHSAEDLFNNYLKENFHMKYSQYRNEEMRLKEEEILRQSFQQHTSNDGTSKPISVLKIDNDQFAIPGMSTTINENNNNDQIDLSKIVKFDRKSAAEREKEPWYIELDKDNFNKKIKQHLRNLLIENDKIEDKDKSAMLVTEDVWNYPNALLYCATVITTIGKFDLRIKILRNKQMII